MKAVVIAALMFGMTSCAVESAPQDESARDESPQDEVEVPAELSVSPKLISTCLVGECEFIQQCKNEGRTYHGVCGNQFVCCT